MNSREQLAARTRDVVRDLIVAFATDITMTKANQDVRAIFDVDDHVREAKLKTADYLEGIGKELRKP